MRIEADVLAVVVAGDDGEEDGDGEGDQGQDLRVEVTSSLQGCHVLYQPESFDGKEEDKKDGKAKKDDGRGVVP